jgi:hypothetical protein
MDVSAKQGSKLQLNLSLLGDIQNSVHEKITEFRKISSNYATRNLAKCREILAYFARNTEVQKQT